MAADPNLTLIRAETLGAPDLFGAVPNHLRVMATNLPPATGVRLVAIEHTLYSPAGYHVLLADRLVLATPVAPGCAFRSIAPTHSVWS